MKLPLLVLASILASTTVQAEVELEGREGLIFRCRQTPGNTESFCGCVADAAVAELPREVRQSLFVWWGHPTVFNFRSASTPNELAGYHEKMWGEWQRRTIPACNAR
jgi:hypothetical protein